MSGSAGILPTAADLEYGRAPLPTGISQTSVIEDPSLETPAQQHDYLVAMIEASDASHPAPYTGTPPWDEYEPEDWWTSETVLSESYQIAPDVEAHADTDLLARVRDAFPPEIPDPYHENDDQYHGLGVNPGVPNFDQPIETGHSQITPPNPGGEQGWDEWSGRPKIARVARMFNAFPGYSKDVKRGLGQRKVIKWNEPLVWQTQQHRDLLLAELKRRGIHNVVVMDVPSVPFTAEVLQVDPTALMIEDEIGPEGVL